MSRWFVVCAWDTRCWDRSLAPGGDGQQKSTWASQVSPKDGTNSSGLQPGLVFWGHVRGRMPWAASPCFYWPTGWKLESRDRKGDRQIMRLHGKMLKKQSKPNQTKMKPPQICVPRSMNLWSFLEFGTSLIESVLTEDFFFFNALGFGEPTGACKSCIAVGTFLQWSGDHATSCTGPASASCPQHLWAPWASPGEQGLGAPPAPIWASCHHLLYLRDKWAGPRGHCLTSFYYLCSSNLQTFPTNYI